MNSDQIYLPLTISHRANQRIELTLYATTCLKMRILIWMVLMEDARTRGKIERILPKWGKIALIGAGSGTWAIRSPDR